MSLPAAVIDRLFKRLAATYGAAWDRSLGNAPEDDVKAAWAHELAGFASRLDCIAWALERLPERCPNVIEFRALCRLAPTPDAPRLAEPAADPARIKAELTKLSPARPQDPKAWAHRIVEKADAGMCVAPCTLRFARQALAPRSALMTEAV